MLVSFVSLLLLLLFSLFELDFAFNVTEVEDILTGFKSVSSQPDTEKFTFVFSLGTENTKVPNFFTPEVDDPLTTLPFASPPALLFALIGFAPEHFNVNAPKLLEELIVTVILSPDVLVEADKLPSFLHSEIVGIPIIITIINRSTIIDFNFLSIFFTTFF